ncbi:hypothetical protein D1B31_13885 [Neobacillus notoginsengisoli]|uniref:Uncharacterized protein n=1 Tax=Neobacillus notoginsengisoli TaxID=1578198 RepID=A0A417YSS9_9BACI|nr:hypothetical protein [Neobacillus notoginsengisoli]RHW39047.1 hypothetical protein D1B31_13885 [Neobacillus notoginsengisoli]
MKRKNVMIWSIVAVLLIVSYYPLKLRGALGQEKEPMKHFLAIVKVDFTTSEYEKISETEYGYVYVSDSSFATVKKFMSEKGWKFTEQYGSGLEFKKDGKTTIVGVKNYSSFYSLWYVPFEVFD